MKSFAVYGASDDLVEQEVDGKPFDETGQPKRFTFLASGKALVVRVGYDGKVGTGWKLAVELKDEDEKGELPFDVRIVQENYSPKLIVENAREKVAVMCGTKIIGHLDPTHPISKGSDE